MSFFSKSYFEKGVEDGHYLKYEHSVKGIDIFIKVGTPRIFIFDGRKKKPSQILCKNNSELILAIENRLKRVFDKNAEKMRQKESDRLMAEENRAKIQVGDIFSTSWGYDRTITDFFEVVERVSNAYVMVRQISASTVSSGAMSAHVKPNVGEYISEAKKCQINKRGDIVKADEFGHTAYKTDPNKEHYISWD